MATPKTQGFALSAAPRAPNVPSNVGVIDIKSVVDGVRQSLAAFENVRRAPQSMLLADAEMEAKTLDAPMGNALVRENVAQAPLRTRQVLAQTEGIETQTPLRTRALELNNRRLEKETTPEFIDAKLKSLLLKTVPSGVREFELLTAGLTEAEKERARQIHLGLQGRTSGAAILYKKVMGEDGVERYVAFDPRGVGAQVIPTGERYGTGVDSPSVPSATQPSVGTVQAPTIPGEVPSGNTVPTAQSVQLPPSAPQSAQTTAATASGLQSPTIGQQKTQEVTAKAAAEAKADARVKLPKAKATLDVLEQDTGRIEREIDQAIAMASRWNTGTGAVLFRNLPETEARKLEGLFKTIRATVGFDKLQQMRSNSPTGGALGNVSDFESQLLQSAIATLDQLQSTADVKEALNKIKKARQNALKLDRARFDHDVHFFGLTDEDFTARAKEEARPIVGLSEDTIQITPTFDEAKKKRILELRAKLAEPAQP